MVYDIKEHGAVGDGVTMNTAVIQKAIDTVSSSGGGTVYITDGVYKIGTVIMKSDVELHITSTATLLGSEKVEDYPERTDLKHVNSSMLPRMRNACLIYADECKNISITGGGKIDCNGTHFVYKKSEGRPDWGGWEYKRIDAPTPPRVVFFTGCYNVKVEDITMVNQPSGWSYWIHDCDYVTFDKCKIYAEVRYPNNDGIHINSSRNVTISNCMITCGDDCIIVRANNASLAENKVCEKVTVTNCNLTSYSACIRIAWLNDGIIRNCTFSNLVMTDSTIGVSIFLPKGRSREKMPDQGREATLIENLSFDNIVMDGIYARPVKVYIPESEETLCEGIRNIYFSNIHARSLEFPYLMGKRDCKLKNICFSNCSFEKVAETVLPNYIQHGASRHDRSAGVQMITNAENVVFNNTSFTCDYIPEE